MNHTLLLMCGLFVAAATPGPAKADDGNQPQVVSAAEITKVDAKKKTLQVREVVPASTTRPRQGSGSGGRGDGGGAGGGGGRRGGGRRGGGVGFPRTGGNGGGNGSTTQAKEYKVFVTKDTALKFAGVDIDFSGLHVGDRIAVSGTPKGSKGDLNATTITRQ